MTCTFFGHTYIAGDYRQRLKEVIIDLIENHGVDKFYVGHHGSFDRTAIDILSEISEDFANLTLSFYSENSALRARINGHRIFEAGYTSEGDGGQYSPEWRTVVRLYPAAVGIVEL